MKVEEIAGAGAKADAFVAASAALHQVQLVTLTTRHFPMLKVEVAYNKPA